jgi:hypothetical protein
LDRAKKEKKKERTATTTTTTMATTKKMTAKTTAMTTTRRTTMMRAVIVDEKRAAVKQGEEKLKRKVKDELKEREERVKGGRGEGFDTSALKLSRKHIRISVDLAKSFSRQEHDAPFEERTVLNNRNV